jgi:hypothetical protein
MVRRGLIIKNEKNIWLLKTIPLRI